MQESLPQSELRLKRRRITWSSEIYETVDDETYVRHVAKLNSAHQYVVSDSDNAQSS